MRMAVGHLSPGAKGQIPSVDTLDRGGVHIGELGRIVRHLDDVLGELDDVLDASSGGHGGREGVREDINDGLNQALPVMVKGGWMGVRGGGISSENSCAR